jgi:cardiolipin synthase
MSAPPAVHASRPRAGLAQIPNAISVARILLVWPIVSTLFEGRYGTALVLVIIAGFSDGLDGFLAKRFDWQSRIGGLLDPLADKLLLISTFVVLTLTGVVASWLTIVVIARDLVIVAGTASYQLWFAPVQPAPTVASKLNTGIQLAFLVTVIAGRGPLSVPQALVDGLGAGVLCTSVVSGLHYVLRWSRKATSRS